MKLLLIQFAFLLISQALLTKEDYRIYLNKAIYFEGVIKDLPPLIKLQ